MRVKFSYQTLRKGFIKHDLTAVSKYLEYCTVWNIRWDTNTGEDERKQRVGVLPQEPQALVKKKKG